MMNNVSKTYILFLFALLPGKALLAQSAWELKKDKDSIRIYTRSTEGSKFNELKVVFNLRGNFEQLRSVIRDVTHYKEWVYASKATTIVERKSEDEIVYYAEVAAPWPLSNRDYYSNTRIWIDSAKKQMHISAGNLANKYKENEHLVRVPFLKAEWTISMLTTSLMQVEYILDWNPGGSIPAWIANMFSTTAPYQSFSQLQKKMAGLNP
ncbi:MAG TPA: START domain-containing protein [Puia sp.]|nr:START domain-containing protein [Puia sp.]